MENKFTDGSLSSPSKNLIGWLVNAKRIVLFNQTSFTWDFGQSTQCYAFILSSLIGQDNFETKRIRYSVDCWFKVFLKYFGHFFWFGCAKSSKLNSTDIRKWNYWLHLHGRLK